MSGRHASCSVRVAIGIGGSVASFQSKLVGAHSVELDKKLFVEFHPAAGVGIDLHHPALYAVGIELLIPGRVKRVGEVDAFAVAADLNHLRAAVEWLVGFLRM